MIVVVVENWIPDLFYRTLYYDTKTKMPFTPFTPGHEPMATTPVSTEGAAYEAGLTTVGEFKTVSMRAPSVRVSYDAFAGRGLLQIL